MKQRVVVSLEQALSLPYATWRFAHLGWRVIRIEATPVGSADPGDPNRYIGSNVAGTDRRSYFLAQNVGKESLVVNLKSERGREVLHRLIERLEVDVFCCNTLPGRYVELGIDYEQLRRLRPDIAIILTSGYFSTEDKEHAQRIGIAELILKPTAIADLGEALSRALA